jgi:SRSO17 transposase
MAPTSHESEPPRIPGRFTELAVCDETIEQDYRELKGALGLDHFEGRGWAGWHHQVTLVAAAHGFLTLERLRRPKQVASA